jgi:hypothetical protein
MATKASAAVAREASTAAPTRTRYIAVAYGMALSFITFLDRAAIGHGQASFEVASIKPHPEPITYSAMLTSTERLLPRLHRRYST